MTVTIELNTQEAAYLQEESARRRQAPELIVRWWMSTGMNMTPPQTLLAESVPAEARAALKQRLIAAGVLHHIPQGRSGPPPRPIPVRGEPVSETIISERR